MGPINEKRWKRTLRNLGRKSFSSQWIILCCALTQIILTGEALAFQIHTNTIAARQSNSRFQTPVRYSDADNADNHNHSPKQYKTKGSKTKKQIQIDLQHQFRALEHNMNHEQHHATLDQTIFSDFDSNLYNSIWACRSVTDVQDVLMRFIDTAKNIIHQASGTPAPSSRQYIQDGLQLIGPNLAAAALRRVIDLRPDLKGRIGSQEDARVARKMIPSLLQIVAREIFHSESLQVPTHFNTNDLYSFSNFVLSMRKLMGPSGKVIDTGLSPVSNANILHSLAKIKLLQKKNGRFNDETDRKSVV